MTITNNVVKLRENKSRYILINLDQVNLTKRVLIENVFKFDFIGNLQFND